MPKDGPAIDVGPAIDMYNRAPPRIGFLLPEPPDTPYIFDPTAVVPPDPPRRNQGFEGWQQAPPRDNQLPAAPNIRGA